MAPGLPGMPPSPSMSGLRRDQHALVETFRKGDFDVAAFVRDATGQGQDRLTRLTQQLQDCASALEEELQREIVACHEDLLHNAGSISDLDGQLGDIREVVDSLKGSITRVQADVMSPFHELKRKAQLLERMQAVNILIRKLMRFLFDVRKLHTQMDAPTKDYSKAAHTLHELESVLQESSLERIDILRGEAAWIRESGARIRKQAEEDLRKGVKQGNQQVLNIAVQVFFNLQCLWPQLRKVLVDVLQEFGQVPLAGGPTFQQSLDMNLQVLVASAQRLYVLDELIRSKTDPLTHKSFTTVLEEEGVSSMTSQFWADAANNLNNKLAKVSIDRAARRALVAACPRLLYAFAEAMDRLSRNSRGRVQVLQTSDREALFAVACDIRNEFLGESIRRVTDPVEVMLPDKLLSQVSASGEPLPGSAAAVLAGEGSAADELPTLHDLKRYVQLLIAELERSEACPDLLLKEAVRSVRSSILFFATRLEQIVESMSTELACFEDEQRLRLRSPLPLPTAGHARNARLFGIAHHTLAALKELVPARFQSAVVTQQVQATLQQTQAAIISPMTATLRRALAAAAGRLEAGLRERGGEGPAALLAVSQACSHVSRHYFALFGSGQLLLYSRELCSFAIRSFVWAASRIQLRSEQERSTLVQDLQALDSLLSSLDSEYTAHVRHEVMVLGEFKKRLSSQPLGAMDFKELLDVLGEAAP